MILPSKKWLFSLLFAFTLFTMSYGQERKLYEGPLKVGPYFGKAVYQYTLVDLDTIFDGDFQLQKSNLETLMEKEDASFLFEGFFDGGIANGPWEFQFGEYKTNSQSQVVDYEYRVLVSGVQEIGSGMLSEGKPDGTWTYTINKIKDSEIDQVEFKSSISFDEGVPQQNFQIENDSSVLVGRLLRDGLAHDEWSFYGTENVEDIENWFFEDGLLRRIQIKSDRVSKEISIFDPNDAAQLETIPLNADYLTLLEALLNDVEGKSHVSQLLKQNQGYYQKMSEVIQALGSPSFEVNMQVKVPYYPLDSVQKQILEQIVSDYKVSHKLSQNILKNSHLNIVKRTDPEAFFYYNVSQKISDEFLSPLGELVNYVEHDVVQYQQVSDIINSFWPNGKPQKDIIAKANEAGEERTFSLPSANEFEYEGDDLLSVAALGTYAKMSLEFIKGSLASRLTNEEQLQLLNGVEETLIKRNDELVQEIDSASGLSETYRNALAQIQNVADSALTTYADIENPTEKLAYGQSLQTCLSDLKVLTLTIKDIPSQQKAIKEEYTTAVWNPFMANVMDEEVKKHIVGAYEGKLIPYFLTTITNEVGCENASALNSQILEVQQNILALRNKDTRKLERKLRREKRPEEILQLLNQELTRKNQ
ncbi:hypothetical protein [Flagellimonas zhangzhouensis]|uniref:Uncharacterized protein n=1 Tax=Flagellimonas zhangzhouensis TaxID=1073328 RepID=A0A1H2SJC7_9FLAO|nr:hypothetical protein [Allomuricauda zhangzhouensis]SDQ74983.1 hypothetical protein SAMN05216294_2459 [Allomuricauda zhangzhouensis]SDW31149.1 hypothetical protein SAMN04487892_1103 [Allomuricauda zhangzhouensis]